MLISTSLGEDTAPIIGKIQHRRISAAEFLMRAWKQVRLNQLQGLKFHYNGVINGLWLLSPNYQSIQELETLIKEKENEMDS